MTKTEEIKYRLHGIEQSELVIVKKPDNFDGKEFTFAINIIEKVNDEKSIVICIVRITISNGDNDIVLAEIQLLIGFEVEDFLDHFTKNTDGQFVLPQKFKNDIHKECISTSRGYVFFLLKGSYLHKAIIPIINVKEDIV